METGSQGWNWLFLTMCIFSIIIIFLEYSLILEYSFFLHQQNTQDPVAAAVEQYKSSGMPARIRKALTKLIPQYNPQDKARAGMRELIMNVISKHLICKPFSYVIMIIY